MSTIPTSSYRVSIVALLVFVAILLSLQPVDSAPKSHGGGGSSQTDEPSGTYYNVVDYNDDYPTNKTVNATEIAQLPPFTKTWPAPSDVDDGPDETSFPNPEYVRLLESSFLFFEAQRSGKLPADQRVKWRNDSALLDGKDAGQDLSGGYYDAGDYLKFTYPMTFSLTEICYGAIEFFEGYTLANQVHYLDQMVRWGMDWLIKANPNNNTLYVQVGISEVDNNYWGPDTGIPLPRPSFFVSRTSPGTDAFADASAAFASCSLLYRDKIKDPTYAALLESRAKDLYNLAETATPRQTYQTVVPAVTCCYSSTGFVDELAWAAAWMYRLTKDESFANLVSTYSSTMAAKEVTTVVSWDDKAALVYIMMAGLTRGNPETHPKWQALAEKFVNQTVFGVKPCSFTPGGMYYCYGASGDDSSVVVANAAFAVNLLAKYMSEPVDGAEVDSATQEKVNIYQAFAVGQVRYLLGENPEKTPYIVGVHPNSPVNPHSALAAGGNSSDSIDTNPAKEAHVLLGALVGGPDKNDRFIDQRSNWRQNEVALDYNAPFTSLMAYQIMTSHDPPPYVMIPPGGRSDRHVASSLPGGLALWQHILILVGVLIAMVLLSIFIYRRKAAQIQAWVALRQEQLRLKKSNSTLHSLPGSQSSMAVGAALTGACLAEAAAVSGVDLEKGKEGQQLQEQWSYPITTRDLSGSSTLSLTRSEPVAPMTGGPMSSSDTLLGEGDPSLKYL